MGFITSFLEDAGYTGIFICIDQLTKLAKLLPCYVGEEELSALEKAKLLFENVVYLYTVPQVVLYNRDPHFSSWFWKPLFEILGSTVLFSSA